jgi:hypothetical protein
LQVAWKSANRKESRAVARGAMGGTSTGVTRLLASESNKNSGSDTTRALSTIDALDAEELQK